MIDRRLQAALPRREFVVSAALLGFGLASCRPSSRDTIGSQAANLADGARQELEARLGALLDENDVPGFAAGLIRSSRLVWSGGFGYADVDQQIPMTAATL